MMKSDNPDIKTNPGDTHIQPYQSSKPDAELTREFGIADRVKLKAEHDLFLTAFAQVPA